MGIIIIIINENIHSLREVNIAGISAPVAPAVSTPILARRQFKATEDLF